MSFFSDLISGPEQKKKEENSGPEKPDNLFRGRSQISKPDFMRELKSSTFLRKTGAKYKIDGKYYRTLSPADIDSIINSIIPQSYGGTIGLSEAISAARKQATKIAQMENGKKSTSEQIIAEREKLRFFKDQFGIK